MPKDSRTYITLHDGMPDHPKIGALSDKAFRAWIELLCWCSRHKTDGKIPKAWFEKVAAPRVRAELEGALIDRDGVDYKIHDYLKHQRSASEIDELSRKRSEAGKKAMAKRWQNGSKTVAISIANAITPAQQTDSKSITDTESYKKIKNSCPTAPPQDDSNFLAFYSRYPRKEAKDAARKAFKVAVRKTTIDIIMAGLDRYLIAVQDKDRQFIALPASWLNAGRWADEYDTPAPVSSIWKQVPRDA